MDIVKVGNTYKKKSCKDEILIFLGIITVTVISILIFMVG